MICTDRQMLLGRSGWGQEIMREVGAWLVTLMLFDSRTVYCAWVHVCVCGVWCVCGVCVCMCVCMCVVCVCMCVCVVCVCV